MSGVNSQQSLLVKEILHGVVITFNCLERRNTLTNELISQLFNLLEDLEKNPKIKVLVFEGQEGIFCTGMDFDETTRNILDSNVKCSHEKFEAKIATAYMNFLKRLSLYPKVVISLVDGIAMAGGVGLICASDIVIATKRSQFILSEALWGLLPANLMPYLIRRVGYQKAYFMTLTTQTIFSEQAYQFHLVDEVTSAPEETLRKYILRLARLDEQTIRDMKNYFRKMWIINDDMEQVAMSELARLMQEPRIQKNIKNFVADKKFPWEID